MLLFIHAFILMLGRILSVSKIHVGPADLHPTSCIDYHWKREKFNPKSPYNFGEKAHTYSLCYEQFLFTEVNTIA